MARKPSAKVVYNRETADAVRLGVADGLLALAEAILERADVPDAPPLGKGLIQHGQAGAWVDGKKVGGQASKPNRMKLPTPGIVVAAGYPFPARFQELGTIHQPPRPFFTPAIEAEIPNAPEHLKPAVRARLAGLR